MTSIALCTGNDVSYATVNDESDFSRQAQYLVRLEGDSYCSAHWK